MWGLEDLGAGEECLGRSKGLEKVWQRPVMEVISTYAQDCGWQEGGGQECQRCRDSAVVSALIGDRFALERGEPSVLWLMLVHMRRSMPQVGRGMLVGRQDRKTCQA